MLDGVCAIKASVGWPKRLQKYIKRQRSRGILGLEGRVEFWSGYDHKDLRAGRPKRMTVPVQLIQADD